MRTLLAFLGTGALCGALGFVGGRWSVRSEELQIGAAIPRAEKDLSPSKEVRTVIAPRVHPGRPTPPPAPVPEGFGEQVSTTTTELPQLPTGGTFHASTFARIDGHALELRTVEWMDTPAGRASLGDSEATVRPLRLALPQPPQWGASLLQVVGEGKQRLGFHVQWTPKALILGAGHLQGHTFVEAGARW